MTVRERAKKIKLIVLDADGVLTDGDIIYDEAGGEYKAFDVKDGFGLFLIMLAGIKSVIITARRTKSIQRRAKETGVSAVYKGCADKLEMYEKALCRFRVSDRETCFIGDDIPDLPVMKRAGLAVAVPDACAEMKKAAHYVTSKSGGKGAVRELAELILKSQSKWDKAVAEYFRKGRKSGSAKTGGG